jgi:hypothetical protein
LVRWRGREIALFPRMPRVVWRVANGRWSLRGRAALKHVSRGLVACRPGLVFAAQEVDRKAEVVAHLCGLPKAFVGVALEVEPV